MLDGRLTDRIEDGEIGDPRHRLHHLLDLAGSLFDCVEIVAVQLDRVLALHTRGRLFDIVLDVLREVEIDPGKFGRQRIIDLLGQLLLVDTFGPGVERLQRYVEFGIEEAGGIGPVVGPPELRDDRYDFGKAPDDLPHAVDVGGRLLERDRRRQRGADPQIAFLEMGQKFEPERPHAEHCESQGGPRHRRG